MAYNAEEKLITAPVSIRNLQDCFGLGDADLGTIITNAAINMWARFKPVKLATVGLITDAQRASVNHGIIMPEPVTDSSAKGKSSSKGTKIWQQVMEKSRLLSAFVMYR